jgi:hypothetical protein
MSMRRAAVGLIGGWLLLLPSAASAAPPGTGEPADSPASAPGDAGTPDRKSVV